MKQIFYLSLFVFLVACVDTPSEPRRVPLDEEPTPIPTAVPPIKTTYTVEQGEVVYQIDFTGRIGPALEQILAFPRDGVVAEVFAQRGDFVAAGDLLATLDTLPLEEELLVVQAERDIAQNRVDALEKEQRISLQRAELQRDLAQLELDFAVEQGGIEPTPEQSIEISRRTVALQLAQLAVDELEIGIDPLLLADIEEANLRVQMLTEALENNQLLAPFDGQLSSFSVSVGQRVQANNRVGLLADTALVEVRATLIESQLLEMSENMVATITLSNQPGVEYPAFVRRLPPPYGSVGANQDVAEDDLSARIAFVNGADAAEFEVGDRARVNIFLEQRENAVWLPPAALREFGGRNFVVVQEDGGERRVDVTLGIEGNGRIEIISGVEAGDVVIGP
ncbi:MAG: HlyD family efflux transporter periplasmic adaptor subunit [Chloroflexota bacterium]